MPPPSAPSSGSSTFSPQDQAKFDAILQAHNYTPPAQPSSSSGGITNWRDLVKNTPTPAPTSPDLGQLTAQQQVKGFNTAMKGVTEAASMFKPDGTGNPVSEVKNTGALLHGGAQSVVGAGQALFAPFTASGQAVINSASDNPTVQSLATYKPVSEFLDAVNKGAQGAQGAGTAWDNFQKAHPDIARIVSDSAGVASTVAGAAGAPDTQALGEATGAVSKGIEDVIGAGDVRVGGAAADKTLSELASETPKAPDTSFVRDLVTPAQTTGKTGTLTSNIRAGRVDEGGILSGRTINPTDHQLAIEKEVQSVPGIAKGQTDLQNANAIHDEIGNTAQNLRTSLLSRKVQPIVTQDHWNTFMDSVKSYIQANPLLVGDAEKTATKILDKFENLLPKGKDVTATDILDARQGLDKWIQSIKGGIAFDPKTENAVSIALRGVRQGANDMLEKVAPDVGVKQMLRRQSLLYDAIENIAPKASKEAGSATGRFFQEHPLIGKSLKYAAIGAGGAAFGGGAIEALKSVAP
jgi:hypothetical protein